MSDASRDYELHRVSERAWLVRFLDSDLASSVARANALHSFLATQANEDPLAGAGGESASQTGRSRTVRKEWVLGAGNLLLRLDGAIASRDVTDAGERLDEIVRKVPFDEQPFVGRTIEVPVRFGGTDGEDLPALSHEVGRTESAIVELLCGAELTVAFLGFAPGFPYLIGLPPELEVPRLASPRPRVPAGSVAIAGPFAGIYPSSTPGGWRLVGRTDLRLFDVASTPPSRLAPGDRVRFVAL